MAKGKKGKSKPRKPDKAKSSTSTDKDGSSTSKPSVTLKTPTSSPLDKNNYKVLQLKNGIRLLLISNEKSVPSPLWHHRSNHPYGIKNLEGDQEQSLSLIQNGNILPFWRDATFTNAPVPSTLPLKSDIMNSNENEMELGQEDMNDLLWNFTTDVRNAKKPKKHARKKLAKSSPVELTSCSITINVGCAEDPAAHCGLAHCLEHMVHYGSKEYPDEDGYFRWMMEHGTGMNAFTQTDTTTYYFECYTSVVPTSLDMLTSMLAHPLLLEDVVEREIHSVDNEFLLKDHHPLWKIFQVIRSSAKKDHPLNSFFCGNLNSLRNGLKDVKSLTKSMKKFHDEYYVGSRMTVAIQSNLPLIELEKIATPPFHKFKEGKGSIRRETVVDKSLLDPFDTVDFKKVNFIGSSHSFNLMVIVWPHRPEVWRDFGNRPLDFISHIMCQEWEGGMFDVLKKSGLVIDIVAASCPHDDGGRNEYCSLFIMKILLSEAGKELQNIKQILLTVFQGLESIKTMSLADKKNLWNEFHVTYKREFDFSGPGKGTDFVASCSRLLQITKEDEIFLSEGVPASVFDNDIFTKTLANFNPQNMHVSFSCKEYPRSVMSIMKEKVKEKYTGILYNRCSLKDLKESNNEDFVKQLTNCESLKIKMSLGKNEFFENQDPSPPSIIEWYRHQDPATDKRFVAVHNGNPHQDIYKSYLKVTFLSPYCRTNEKSRKLLTLLVDCVLNNGDVRNHQSELARAGVDTLVVPSFDGIDVHMLGFPSSLVKGTQVILRDILMAMDNISETDYNIFKEKIFAHQKEILGNPLRITWDLLSELLIKEKYPAEEGIKVTRKMEYSDLLNFSRLVMDSFVLTIVSATGNISKVEFNTIIEAVLGLNVVPLLGSIYSLLTFPTFLSLPFGNKCIRVRSNCRFCVNTAVTNVYSFTSKDITYDAIQFTEALMKGASFWYLRTYKQLGYMVFSGFLYVREPMIFLTVVGPATKNSACLFDETIDSFLNLFDEMCLSQLTQEEVEEMKTYWRISGNFNIDQIRQWYRTQVLPNIHRNDDLTCKWESTTSASKLSIQVLGNDDESCKGHKTCKNPPGIEKPIKETKPDQVLTFASNKYSASDYYISNIKASKKGSP